MTYPAVTCMAMFYNDLTCCDLYGQVSDEAFVQCA